MATEGSMAPALEVALEYIFNNNWIDERHVLLRSRLVSRAWRACFSGEITAATLHTLADVELAAEYFPSTPGRRLPWRNVEESHVFPMLNKLNLSESLFNQICDSSGSIELLASMQHKDMNVSIGYRGEKNVSKLQNLGGIISSLQLSSGHSLDSVFNARMITGLSCLTRLSITDASSLYSSNSQPLHLQGDCLGDLSQLSSLRELQVSDLRIQNYSQLTDWLRACAALSQLTRLDLIRKDERECSGTLDSLSRLIHGLAPQSLHRLTMHLRLQEMPREVIECKFEWKNGCLAAKHCSCHIDVDLPENAREMVSRQLSYIQQYAMSPCKLSAHLHLRFPPTRFLIDLTNAASVQHLRIFLSSDFLSSSKDMTEDLDGVAGADVEETPAESADNNGRSSSTFLCNTIKPFLTIQEGMHMAATSLVFEFSVSQIDRNLTDRILTDMLQSLPTLFPYLQELTMAAPSGGSLRQCFMWQLTRLTYLSLDVGCYGDSMYIPLTPLALPTSLRELSLSSNDLRLVSFADLAHLTSLHVEKSENDNSVLDAVYRSRAPLKTLCLQGGQFHIYMLSLVEAFPHLETLNLHLNSFDISPLSSLRLLRTLIVYLPSSVRAVLRGVDTLTSLATLKVMDANDCLDALDDVVKLTHLRHLEYCIYTHNSQHTLERIATKCRERVKILRVEMPHTQIDMTFNHTIHL